MMQEAGVKRPKGTCFALLLSSVQLKDVCGFFEGGDGEMQRANISTDSRESGRETRDHDSFSSSI